MAARDSPIDRPRPADEDDAAIEELDARRPSTRADLDAMIVDLGRLAADLYFEGKLGRDPEPER